MRGRGEAPHAGALPYRPIREPHAKQLHAPTRRARARVVPVVAAVGAAPSHDGSTRPARPPTLFLLPKEMEMEEEEDEAATIFILLLFLRFQKKEKKWQYNFKKSRRVYGNLYRRLIHGMHVSVITANATGDFSVSGGVGFDWKWKCCRVRLGYLFWIWIAVSEGLGLWDWDVWLSLILGAWVWGQFTIQSLGWESWDGMEFLCFLGVGVGWLWNELKKTRKDVMKRGLFG